jgi:hypothetical protein
MFLAGLLGVCTSNNLGTCRKRVSDAISSRALSSKLFRAVFGAVFTIGNGLFGVETTDKLKSAGRSRGDKAK